MFVYRYIYAAISRALKKTENVILKLRLGYKH